MRAHQFGNEWIKLPHQRASRLIIMLERSFNQRACMRIIHVIESASTPTPMTGAGEWRLQFLQLNLQTKCNRRDPSPVISYRSAKKRAANNKLKKLKKYETKPNDTCSRGCDRPRRLCCGTSSTRPRRGWCMAWTRIWA